MAGSRRGVPNRVSRDMRSYILKLCTRHNTNPFRVLVELMADPLSPWRFQAAKELAQYLEPKLRAMEHTGDVTHTVRVIDHRYGNGTSPRTIDLDAAATSL